MSTVTENNRIIPAIDKLDNQLVSVTDDKPLQSLQTNHQENIQDTRQFLFFLTLVPTNAINLFCTSRTRLIKTGEFTFLTFKLQFPVPQGIGVSVVVGVGGSIHQHQRSLHGKYQSSMLCRYEGKVLVSVLSFLFYKDRHLYCHTRAPSWILS